MLLIKHVCNFEKSIQLSCLLKSGIGKRAKFGRFLVPDLELRDGRTAFTLLTFLLSKRRWRRKKRTSVYLRHAVNPTLGKVESAVKAYIGGKITFYMYFSYIYV